MKKLISLMMVYVLLFSLSGCAFRYRGDRTDLYTVAVNNIFGVLGYESNGEAVFDPYIEVIDTDDYGRVLFFYDEGYRNTYGKAIVIMQKYEVDFVYYYQDVCQIPYIVTEGSIVTTSYSDMFSQEQIESLKEANDWNKPLDADKCTRTAVVDSKNDEGTLRLDEDDFERVIKSYVTEHGYKGDDTIYRHSVYCNTDKYGREIFYVYGVGRDVKGEGLSPTSESKWYYFAIIFNPDKSCPKENIYEIIDPTESYEAIKQLKEDCGWNKPWISN
nr:hypothetical protein [Oscillospiraceae bacterium]